MKKKEEQRETAQAETLAEEKAAQEAAQPDAQEAQGDEKTALLAERDALKQESEDLKRKWYAVTAEYENYRRRTANEAKKRYAEGRADVVSKLFPIADNLDRALESCKEEGTRRGIELVQAAFEKILEEENISVIDPVGQPFDAEKHEAIMAVEPDEGEESGCVRQVYRKGYEQSGKVLRFAQVVVVK